MGQGEIVEIAQGVLWPVVLYDEQQRPDAICVHSNDVGPSLIAQCAANLFHLCMFLQKRDSIPLVVINGTTKEEWKKRQNIEFGGTEMWRDLMLTRGAVPEEYILSTNIAVHTGAEADEFVRLAKERRWKTVVDVALPYHQLRCFLTMIQAMRRARYYLDVYNLTFPISSWTHQARRVLLGGAFEEGTYLNRIFGEHDRIARYTKEGKCATLADALAYLAKRGTGAWK
ncbi:MAG: hypothetical protein AAB604_02715 [Patescibacteria group bacterium]